jgi:hypothetical protein
MVATRGQRRNAPAGLWNITAFFVAVDANLNVPQLLMNITFTMLVMQICFA